MPAFVIRDEEERDAAAIRAVTLAAFATMPYSQQTEAAIVDALRAAGALAVSLVAVDGEEVVGHVAFSPVTIDGVAAPGWYGVGPLSVRPGRQGSGIGSALMREGIARLRELGGKGGVVVGDPAYTTSASDSGRTGERPCRASRRNMSGSSRSGLTGRRAWSRSTPALKRATRDGDG